MIRIGVDFGGTKIEAAALDPSGRIAARVRQPNPGAYEAALQTVREVVEQVEREARSPPTRRVGVGMPGSLSPRTGLVRNANSTWLNGRRFDADLARTLDREVRVANDANCFALSEAADGAAAGARVVFGLILGTGCGGGVVADGVLLEGINGVAGEIGHIPLPWPTAAERGSRPCWCGLTDCLETFVSGSAFTADYARASGEALDGAAVMARVRAGEAAAGAVFATYLDRLGRGLAVLCNLIDPDVVVIGGGMSNVAELYEGVKDSLRRHIFSDVLTTRLTPARHGDSSGVRGAAWLWPPPG